MYKRIAIPSNPTSRHFGLELGRAQLEKYARGDFECLVNAYYLPSERIVERLPKAEGVVDDKLEKLREHYDFGLDEQNFLRRHEFLFTPLFHAVHHATAIFGDEVPLRLEVVRDGAGEQLFGFIATKQPASKAVAKLSEFDEVWWFKVPKEIHDYLEFSLEYGR